MAKLIFLAAVLVALFAITQVSSYRTIITTTVVEEGNPRESQQERCRQQIQQQTQQQFEQLFRPCQMHFSQQSESYDIAMIMDRNPQQQQLQQCCQQLRKINEECRCEAVQMVVDQQQKQQQQQQHQEEGQRREQQMRQIVQKAEELPGRCNITPRRCQIQIQSS